MRAVDTFRRASDTNHDSCTVISSDCEWPVNGVVTGFTVRNGRPSLSQKRVHREKRFQSGFAQSMPRRGATPLAAAARLPLQICSPAAFTQSVEAAGLKITSRNRSTAVDLVPGVALQLRDGRLARSGVYV